MNRWKEIYSDCLSHAKKWGFKGSDAKHLARLMTYVFTGGEFTITKEEKQRWIEAGILSRRGKIYVDNPEQLEESLFWILAGLAWKGLVKRVNKN